MSNAVNNYTNAPLADVISRAGACSSSKGLPCEQLPPLRAIILYPSLGIPMLLAPGQKKCSLFIAVLGEDRRFGVKMQKGLTFPKQKAPLNAPEQDIYPAPCAYPYIDRHLRLVGMADNKPGKADITQGELYGDGTTYAKAMAAIHVWKVGELSNATTVIRNRHGQPVATLNPWTRAAYPDMWGASIFEVELDLATLATPITGDAFLSFAWKVKCPETFGTFKKDQIVHYQDFLLAKFLQKQFGNPNLRHAQAGKGYFLNEYYVSQAARKGGQLAANGHRLAAWHPVKRLKAAAPLKLGHLSDVHINVRHLALSHSPVSILPPETPEAGDLAKPFAWSKLCNAFQHLAKLTSKMKAKGADAIVMTGDFIDFNRNITPSAVEGKPLAEQWKAYNILSHLNKNAPDSIYRRGMDDILFYSLLRQTYVQDKLAVFLTTGNHDAYATPYGVSPRKEGWSRMLGAYEQVHAADSIAKHRQDLEEASKWQKDKANSGIAADHNLTIYEITLAYGPTYTHLYTTDNFTPDRFDWFSAWFAPLADYCLPIGGEPDTSTPQAVTFLTGLGWGDGENYKNLGELASPKGRDQQGYGILPRATQSLNGAQLAILNQLGRWKPYAPNSKAVVASHFTVVNFGENPDGRMTPFTGIGVKEPLFIPRDSATGAAWDASFNRFNLGTCERNMDWYFNHMLLSKSPVVDVHFSGHSHHSAVYQIARHGKDGVCLAAAPADPGLEKDRTFAPAFRPVLAVSSCGGPIGIQDLNGELSGWTLRPPSGTLLSDPAKLAMTQVATTEGSAKPRLCVALDYLAVMSTDEGSGIAAPLFFPRPTLKSATNDGKSYPPIPRSFDLALSQQVFRLNCIEGVRFWVFKAEKKTKEGAIPKAWHVFPITLGSRTPHKDASGRHEALQVYEAQFADADRQALLSILADQFGAFPRWAGENHKTSLQAFCEVTLKAPADAWAKDMNAADPWVFPVDITCAFDTYGRDVRYTWLFKRPEGERGEVPDWDFWHEHYKTELGYPKKDDVIKNKTSQ